MSQGRWRWRLPQRIVRLRSSSTWKEAHGCDGKAQPDGRPGINVWMGRHFGSRQNGRHRARWGAIVGPPLQSRLLGRRWPTTQEATESAESGMRAIRSYVLLSSPPIEPITERILDQTPLRKAQRLDRQAYESPALPLSYSAETSDSSRAAPRRQSARGERRQPLVRGRPTRADPLANRRP
jgi:hypothetical protein